LRLRSLIASIKRLRPEDQPRELLSDYPQLVFRADFVAPVDHPDQRADMLLGQLKELLAQASVRAALFCQFNDA
jgi:hypothetical protein